MRTLLLPHTYRPKIRNPVSMIPPPSFIIGAYSTHLRPSQDVFGSRSMYEVSED